MTVLRAPVLTKEQVFQLFLKFEGSFVKEGVKLINSI